MIAAPKGALPKIRGSGPPNNPVAVGNPCWLAEPEFAPGVAPSQIVTVVEFTVPALAKPADASNASALAVNNFRMGFDFRAAPLTRDNPQNAALAPADDNLSHPQRVRFRRTAAIYLPIYDAISLDIALCA